MARPRKIGLSYFPMDTTLDENFESIEELHGNDGFTWMVKFWQAAYKTDDGIVDLSDIHGVIGAKKSRISTDKQSEILKDAIKLKLLYEVAPGKYTSTGIQKRLSKISDDREYDRNYAKNELSERKQTDNLPITGEKEKEKEIKKEIKIKYKIQVPEHLVEIWPKFLEMRKKLRKPATEHAETLLWEKLNKLSLDPSVQIEIVKQSIENSWQGLFPLSQQQQTILQQPKTPVQKPYPQNSVMMARIVGHWRKKEPLWDIPCDLMDTPAMQKLYDETFPGWRK